MLWIYMFPDVKQKGTHDILVLGEHSMFCISENGEVRIQKRLGYFVASCNAYSRVQQQHCATRRAQQRI